jgi:hypothetical protein
MIINLFMFANPQAAFAMLSLRPNYLQHTTIFPSLGILLHYTKFDVHTIAMLKKLLALGSFNNTMGVLTRCYITIPISSRGLGLPLEV